MPFSVHTRSDAEPIDPSLVQFAVSVIGTQQYFNVALLTVLIYHSLITMDKEVRYFWPNMRNSVSLIYFANRYVGIVGAIFPVVSYGLKESPAMCRFSDWTDGISNLITIVLIDYILLIRVLALYHQNKMLGVCLKVLLAMEAVIGLAILIYGVLFEEVGAGSIAEGIVVCGLNRGPPVAFYIISWAIPMTYGLVLLVLALYRAAEYWRQSSGFKGFDLVAVLIQDQVVYYAFVIYCCILKIVFARINGINQFVADVLNTAGSPTLLCVLGGQLLINLKEAGERGVNGATNYRSKSVSDIEFA